MQCGPSLKCAVDSNFPQDFFIVCSLEITNHLINGLNKEINVIKEKKKPNKTQQKKPDMQLYEIREEW